MTSLIRKVMRRFRRSEDGTATIEFVLVFPAFMILFVSAFEAGIMMTRQVMLERGLDMAVRSIRLGTAHDFTFNEVKTMICNGAGIIPNCMTNLKLEMQVVSPIAWVDIPRVADCVDVDEPFLAARQFENGAENQIMVLRACSLFRPIFPGTGLGFQLPRKSGDNYALVSSSAFVMEPL
jgi:hypothetical protein